MQRGGWKTQFSSEKASTRIEFFRFVLSEVPVLASFRSSQNEQTRVTDDTRIAHLHGSHLYWSPQCSAKNPIVHPFFVVRHYPSSPSRVRFSDQVLQSTETLHIRGFERLSHKNWCSSIFSIFRVTRLILSRIVARLERRRTDLQFTTQYLCVLRRKRVEHSHEVFPFPTGLRYAEFSVLHSHGHTSLPMNLKIFLPLFSGRRRQPVSSAWVRSRELV